MQITWNFISKRVAKAQFFLHRVKWFQVFLSNTNNYIWYYINPLFAQVKKTSALLENNQRVLQCLANDIKHW